MKSNIELILSDKILDRIPLGVKPSDYLADILDLSRESVYRRLKGTVPFTFEEALTVASDLRFSLDEIFNAGNKPERAIFNLWEDKPVNAEERFLTMLKGHRDNMEMTYKAREKQIIMISNRILAVYACGFENLFKFSYYKWLHMFGGASFSNPYSDLKIPEELDDVRQKAISYSGVQNAILISDRNLLYNTIQEIKYYSDSGLINKDDLQLIKGDLRDFVEGFYLFSVRGTYGHDAKYEVYLSSLNIENNISCIICDGKLSSYYWAHSDSCLYTSDPAFSALQKERLDSLKKYSTLVTGSNEKMQAELYNLFLEQLETLD